MGGGERSSGRKSQGKCRDGPRKGETGIGKKPSERLRSQKEVLVIVESDGHGAGEGHERSY